MARREVEGWALDEGNRIAREMSLKEATYVTIAKGLQRERARAVRIVKRCAKEGAQIMTEPDFNDDFRKGMKSMADYILLHLQKGRA